VSLPPFLHLYPLGALRGATFRRVHEVLARYWEGRKRAGVNLHGCFEVSSGFFVDLHQRNRASRMSWHSEDLSANARAGHCLETAHSSFIERDEPTVSEQLFSGRRNHFLHCICPSACSCEEVDANGSLVGMGWFNFHDDTFRVLSAVTFLPTFQQKPGRESNSLFDFRFDPTEGGNGIPMTLGPPRARAFV
jgi:hypothetical protein